MSRSSKGAISQILHRDDGVCDGARFIVSATHSPFSSFDKTRDGKTKGYAIIALLMQ